MVRDRRYPVALSPAEVTMPRLPMIGFAATSGSGKTTLLGRVIPELRARGLRPAVIKHSHHDFEIDQPGKDSHRLRLAGAGQLVLASPYRQFWVKEGDGRSEPELSELLARLDPSSLDVVLVEGFREASLPKIEVHRVALHRPLLALADPDIVAVACDAPPEPRPRVPLLPLDDAGRIVDFIVDHLHLRPAAPGGA
jgi:molybdopterin-guanine dinucleotide biosynthesis protein MobB